LEERSGNDRSPKSLKQELERLCGRLPSREELVEMVESRRIDATKITMPSFTAFRSRLIEVLKNSVPPAA